MKNKEYRIKSTQLRRVRQLLLGFTLILIITKCKSDYLAGMEKYWREHYFIARVKKGGPYYYFDDYSIVRIEEERYSKADDDRYNRGNYFRTPHEVDEALSGRI